MFNMRVVLAERGGVGRGGGGGGGGGQGGVGRGHGRKYFVSKHKWLVAVANDSNNYCRWLGLREGL